MSNKHICNQLTQVPACFLFWGPPLATLSHPTLLPHSPTVIRKQSKFIQTKATHTYPIIVTKFLTLGSISSKNPCYGKILE